MFVLYTITFKINVYFNYRYIKWVRVRVERFEAFSKILQIRYLYNMEIYYQIKKSVESFEPPA